MQVCHKDLPDHPPTSERVSISTMMADRFELYRHAPPPGQPINTRVQPLLVDESIPEDEEIAWAVRRICLN